MTDSTPDARAFATGFAGAFWRWLRPLMVFFLGVSVAFVIFLRHTERSDRIELQRELHRQLVQLPGVDGKPVDRPLETLALIESQIEDIRETYGIQIHFLYSPERYYPRSWFDETILPQGGQLSADELRRTLSMVHRFLSTYPARVLKHNLTDIYILRDLGFYDMEYGGVYTGSSIYINNNGESEGYTQHDILSSLHHEFSSILMYNYDFPFEAWGAVNAPGYIYPDNAVEMLGSDESYEINETLLSSGFLQGYSQSTLENDFNVMSGRLFTRGSELEALAKTYDRIDRKMRLAIEFYKRVDPEIDIR